MLPSSEEEEEIALQEEEEAEEAVSLQKEEEAVYDYYQGEEQLDYEEGQEKGEGSFEKDVPTSQEVEQTSQKTSSKMICPTFLPTTPKSIQSSTSSPSLHPREQRSLGIHLSSAGMIAAIDHIAQKQQREKKLSSKDVSQLEKEERSAIKGHKLLDASTLSKMNKVLGEYLQSLPRNATVGRSHRTTTKVRNIRFNIFFNMNISDLVVSLGSANFIDIAIFDFLLLYNYDFSSFPSSHINPLDFSSSGVHHDG